MMYTVIEDMHGHERKFRITGGNPQQLMFFIAETLVTIGQEAVFPEVIKRFHLVIDSSDFSLCIHLDHYES